MMMDNAEKERKRDVEEQVFLYEKIPRRGIFSSFPYFCLTVKYLIVSFFARKGAARLGPPEKKGEIL